MATQKLVLPDWSTDAAETGVLTLHVSLTADCKVAGVKLDAVKGREAEAAMVSFQLGELMGDRLKPDQPSLESCGTGSVNPVGYQ